MAFVLRAIDEPTPGPKLREAYAARADAYAASYLREGDAARPTLEEARRELESVMPELVPVYERMVEEVALGDPLAAAMFTFVRPPPALTACSQGVWRGEGTEPPVLVRNYDYDPNLMDGLVLRSRFLDRTVVGTTDGLWGLTDGVNDVGLAISLTFGGRVVVGGGFGMPLIVRYLLETCDAVADVREALVRLPTMQAYNLTLADASGAVLTAYLAPDRLPSFRRLPLATNHQWFVEAWDPQLAESTVAREWHLIRLLDDPDVDAATFADAFLRPPLYSPDHVDGVGTVYTAVYVPSTGEVSYRWPTTRWDLSIDGFREGERSIVFPSVPAVVTGGPTIPAAAPVAAAVPPPP